MHTKLENLALKTVAKQMPEAIVLADRKGCIVWVNPAFEKLCGYTLSEVQGKHPGRILQGKDTDPETSRAFRLAVKEGLEINEDILNYHKDGCSYWARVSITPLRGATGALQGFIAIERDVTEQHERLEELHGEVVELYSSLLREEESRGLKVAPGDPFHERVKR
jgi:PAS domain S-box-containing protein